MSIQDIKIESDKPIYIENLVIDTSYLDERLTASDLAFGRIIDGSIKPCNIIAKDAGHLVIIANLSVSPEWGLYVSFTREIEAEAGDVGDFSITSNDQEGSIVPRGVAWTIR